MIVPNIDKVLAMLLSFITALNACQPAAPWHKPDTPAKTKIIVAIENCNGHDGLNAMQERLTQKLEAYHVFYQGITSDADKGELIFNIIGHEDEKNEQSFSEILTSEPNLKLITAFRATDYGIRSLLDSIILKENLSGIFDLNLKAGTNYGAFGSLAVLGGCNKEGLNLVNSAFQKYEKELPFKICWGENESAVGQEQLMPAFLMYGTNKKPKNTVTQDNVTSATVSPNPYSGELEIVFRMDAKGAKGFAEMTTAAAYDNNREILILVDDMVVSAPRVNDPILGGAASISGNHSQQEAEEIALLLNLGSAPCQVKSIKEGKLR